MNFNRLNYFYMLIIGRLRQSKQFVKVVDGKTYILDKRLLVVVDLNMPDGVYRFDRYHRPVKLKKSETPLFLRKPYYEKWTESNSWTEVEDWRRDRYVTLDVSQCLHSYMGTYLELDGYEFDLDPRMYLADPIDCYISDDHTKVKLVDSFGDMTIIKGQKVKHG